MPNPNIPPVYRPQDINVGALFIETKQDLVEANQNLTAANAEIAALEAQLQPPVVVVGSGTFGNISVATTSNFTFSWVTSDNTSRVVLGLYTGDAGAFRISEFFGQPLGTGQGGLSSQSVTTGLVWPDDLAGFVNSFQIEALAADSGVAKTGVLTFSYALAVGQQGFVPGPTVATINLSKTYTAP
jgi:hypothetical protein